MHGVGVGHGAAGTSVSRRILYAGIVRRDGVVGAVQVARGVSVAVQVMPPSLDCAGDRLPPVTLRSVLVKSFTASLKVMVTSDICPALSVPSTTTMPAVGRWVSMA